jgi:hypothetical protein
VVHSVTLIGSSFHAQARGGGALNLLVERAVGRRPEPARHSAQLFELSVFLLCLTRICDASWSRYTASTAVKEAQNAIWRVVAGWRCLMDAQVATAALARAGDDDWDSGLHMHHRVLSSSRRAPHFTDAHLLRLRSTVHARTRLPQRRHDQLR